jgi:RNA polymerase sigma factor (sigma-70 family)
MVKKLSKSAFPFIKIIFTFFGMKTLSRRYSLGMKLEELQRFLEQHEKCLILYARQWCNTPEDVVQEALMELVRKQLDPMQNTAWVYTVVRNKAVSVSRRSTKQKPMVGQDCEPWFEPNTGDAIDAHAAQLHLQELDESIREVLVLKLWGGLSFEEIAPLAQCSKSEAHRRYQQGLELLRKKMGLL